MSIVENFKFIWKIILFILTIMIFSRCLIAAPQSWQHKLNQRILAQWQSISGQSIQKAKVSMDNLPNDYQLPNCQHEINISYNKPLSAGTNGIKLSCSNPFWQQHLSIRLHWFQPVAYFARAVRAKQLLKLKDIRMVTQDVGSLNQGYFDSPEKLVDMVSRRQFSIGTQITPAMLDPKTIIHRGQTVVIRLKKTYIKIEIQGKALSDGHLNQKIRVRNSRSKKILYARVIEAGIVQID